MHSTAQPKKSAGALTLNQIILAFALLIVIFAGQVSALPAPLRAPLRGGDHTD